MIDVAVLVVASVRATYTLVFVVLGGERLERPVVGCVFDSGHVFAEGIAVDVVRARTGHQFVGHVVNGDHVLVVCRVLVGDLDESEGTVLPPNVFCDPYSVTTLG